jgi:hypothetical protein
MRQSTQITQNARWPWGNVGGSLAQVIDYKLVIDDMKEKASVTLWLDMKTGLPLKRTSTVTWHADTVTNTETYEIQLNLTIDDDLFSVPDKVPGGL